MLNDPPEGADDGPLLQITTRRSVPKGLDKTPAAVFSCLLSAVVILISTIKNLSEIYRLSDDIGVLEVRLVAEHVTPEQISDLRANFNLSTYPASRLRWKWWSGVA